MFEPYAFDNGAAITDRLMVVLLPDGTASKEELAWLRGRAGNIGMFVTAATLVSPEGKAFSGQPESVNEDDVYSLRQVAVTIQAQGAKAILQIHHGGKLAVKDLTGGRDIVAPSADEASGAREMTGEEIRQTIAAFAQATELAVVAGFDGVEIHGANNYLIQQFYSGHSNRRSDEWGGSREKRMAFPLAVVKAVTDVAKRCGNEKFIIGYRFSPEEPETEGLTMEDTFALIDALVQTPLQYLHVSLWDFYKKARRGADAALTRMQLIHERIGGKLPLIGVGNLFTAEQILEAYQTGWAEFIALGKTVMINPNIGDLIANGEEADIITRLDPEQEDRYRIPSALWAACLQGPAYLPPLKDKAWQPVDL